MLIEAWDTYGIQAFGSVNAKSGAAEQVIVVVTPSRPDPDGRYRDPEMVRVGLPASPPVPPFALGAQVRLRDVEISEWRAGDGRHGVRRTARAVEILTPGPNGTPNPAPQGPRRGES